MILLIKFTTRPIAKSVVKTLPRDSPCDEEISRQKLPLLDISLQCCITDTVYQVQAGEMFFLNLGSEGQPVTLQNMYEKMHLPVLFR